MKNIAIPLLVVSIAACFCTEGLCDDDPLEIIRKDDVFESVTTNKPAGRRVSSWHHDYILRILPEKLRKTYNDSLWNKELRQYFREIGMAGIDGPFSTWSINRLGEEWIAELHDDYGMIFPFFMHTSWYSNQAREKGARYLWFNGRVAPWDPLYQNEAEGAIRDFLNQYGDREWIGVAIGRDEPFNYMMTVRSPAVVDSINTVIRNRYGLSIGLPPIDLSATFEESSVDSEFIGRYQLDIAILRIAAARLMNEEYAKVIRRERSLVYSLAPGLKYHAYNRNAINIADFIDPGTGYSLDVLDQSCYYELTDCVSADPYPTATLERDGRARALYHVGFISKLVTDLGAGIPSKMVLQACSISGRYPHPDNLREWAGQAAKAGVTHLEWYTAGAPRYVWREGYREMLRVSRIWRDLPMLDIPARSGIAVIFSDDSRLGANDAAMHPHYMMHVLLGEKLGAWFTFVGENQVRKGQQTLDGMDIIIAPVLGFVSSSFSDVLFEKVKNGASLVLLDPGAFYYDIETGPLADVRLSFAGTLIGEKRGGAFIVPTPGGFHRFGGNEKLPVSPSKNGVDARTTPVPNDATIFFTFADGSPAVYSRKIGSGEVIVFNVQPFGNSDFAIAQTKWEQFFAALIDEAGIERNLPIWRFRLPDTGGEVDIAEPLCFENAHK